MEDKTNLVSSSISIHIFFIFILVVIILINYYQVQKEQPFMQLAKKLKKITPYFHSVNFIIAYTGFVLSGYTHNFNPIVILMIPTTLFLMISEIKRYKKMRVIKIKDTELQNEFKIFAKKIYVMQLIAIAATYIMAKLF